MWLTICKETACTFACSPPAGQSSSSFWPIDLAGKGGGFLGTTACESAELLEGPGSVLLLLLCGSSLRNVSCRTA